MMFNEIMPIFTQKCTSCCQANYLNFQPDLFGICQPKQCVFGIIQSHHTYVKNRHNTKQCLRWNNQRLRFGDGMKLIIIDAVERSPVTMTTGEMTQATGYSRQV